MYANARTALALKNAVDSLFYIFTNNDSEVLKAECQRMINVLYREFPRSMPQPQNKNGSFAK